jgi:hypothetical protein
VFSPAVQAEFYSTLKVGPDRPRIVSAFHADGRGSSPGAGQRHFLYFYPSLSDNLDPESHMLVLVGADSNAPYAEETLAPSNGGTSGKIRPELANRATVVKESKRC